MLKQLGALSPGHRVWLRINPGFGHGHSHKTNTGGEHSKHGIWHADLGAALAVIAQHGLYLVGLHMHIGSGVDYVHLNQVCQAMVALAAQVPLAIPLHAVSAGGGLSTPYRPSDASIDPSHYFGLWDAARRQIAAARGHAFDLRRTLRKSLKTGGNIIRLERRRRQTREPPLVVAVLRLVTPVGVRGVEEADASVERRRDGGQRGGLVTARVGRQAHAAQPHARRPARQPTLHHVVHRAPDPD